MQQFLSFLIKEFRHMLRDWRTLLILFGMPIVMVLLFGYAITTEVRETRVAVFDTNGDTFTRTLSEAFRANEYFTVVKTVQTEREAEKLFQEGLIDVAVRFIPDFESEAGKADGAVVQLLIDGTEPNQASVRQGYASQVIASVVSSFQTGLSAADTPRVTVLTRMLYNPQSRSEYNFVPAVIGMILLLLCTMMTSVSIVREKEAGTMEVLLASPLPPAVIVAAKLIPFFIVSICDLVVILLLSYFLLSVPIAGSLVTLTALSVLYILVALMLGLFISNLVRTQLAAMLISLLLIIPTIYFSGMVFQIESMPTWAHYVSAVVPARWYMDAARRVMIQGVEVTYVWKNFIVLGIELLVLFILSVRLFKTRLE